MATYKLVSYSLCPYVQRSAIALEHKGVEYVTEIVDLANKPDWFRKISPYGKVPLLIADDVVLFESAVINEYLDEVAGEPVHPQDPLQRAFHRAWIEFTSSLVMENYYVHMAMDEERARYKAKKVNGMLAQMEMAYQGPFFAGENFSLVDAAMAPVLQRITWTEELEPSLGELEGRDKMKAWHEALSDHPAVKAATPLDLRQTFVEYCKGRGSPARNEPPSWLGQRIPD